MRFAPKHEILAVLLLISGQIGFTRQASAQGGVPLWTNVYQGYPVGGAYGVATDSNGDVVLSGQGGTVAYSSAGRQLWTRGPDFLANALAADNTGKVFLSGYLYSGNQSDYMTVAYSSAGLPLWTNRYDGPAHSGDVVSAAAVDTSGDVFVTGYAATLAGNQFATLAYSNTGVPLWTNLLLPAFSSDARASAIATDGSKVVVTGSSHGSGPQYYATAAYSISGVPLWTNRNSGDADASATAVKVGGDGTVFVTGYAGNPALSSPVYRCATLAFSATGDLLWSRVVQTGNPQLEIVAHPHIAIGPNGNVVVACTGSNYDYITLCYLPDGTPLWTNHYSPSPSDWGTASGVAVDANGNIFVTGFTSATNGCSDRPYALATVAYSGAGLPLWTNSYRHPSGGYAWNASISIDCVGNVFVAGTTDVCQYNSPRYVLIKYSSSAQPYLSHDLVNGQLVLSWTNSGFVLQSAPYVAGPFTNIPSTTSWYTNPITGAQQFFRLKNL